ncbi:hypothetical protein [Shimia sediminis]|uniref:hypothetical protein n=1 Tax=Shimia sediminis TaxID=2497945 RepID=UPI000F8EF542|nr:hypothetical protein [Shimia sediminis]
MDRIATITAFTFLTASFTSAAPIEDEAYLTRDWTRSHAQTLANEASALIRAKGYRCDSISSLQRWVYGGGFDVVCNKFRYKYELEDKGGRWTVTLK